MLMLGKLCTCLSDESFRTALLLRSWHQAGLLPQLNDMAQCLRDSEPAEAKWTKRLLIDNELVGHTLRKKVRIDTGSSDTNL